MGSGSVRAVSDGELVFEQGDTGRVMYVIKSGKVDIFRTKHEREVKLATLGEEEYFGEMSLLLGAPRSASARANGDVELYVYDKDEFARLAVGEPIVWDLMTAMGKRIQDVDSKLEELQAHRDMRQDALSSFMASRREFY
jgi:CRP-like cAMP-binding protein